MEKPDLQNIIDRVAKMLRLASDQGAAPGERENALRMAHKTMNKYNLDLSEITMQESGGKYVPEGRFEQVCQIDKREWALGIAAECAKLNFCAMVYRRRWDHLKGDWSKYNDVVFIGSQANAVTAGLFASEMVEGTYREYSKRKKLGRPYARSFAMGVWTELHRRVKDMVEEDKQDKRLALIHDEEGKANAELTTNAKPPKDRKRKGVEFDGFLEGIAHGKTLGLNRRMND